MYTRFPNASIKYLMRSANHDAVLYWTESFWPRIGGSEVAAMLLLEHLRQRAYQFEVVTRQWSPDHPAIDTWQGIPIHRIPFDDQLPPRLARQQLAGSIARVAAVKRRFLPDLIHIGLTGPTLFLHQFTSWPNVVPTIVSLHVGPTETEYGKHKPVHETLRSANRLVAVSEAMAAQIRERLPELAGRCVMIHNALPEPATPLMPISFTPPRLVCIGRVTRQKGFDTAIAAMPLVRKAFPEAELLIAGDGEEPAHCLNLPRD